MSRLQHAGEFAGGTAQDAERGVEVLFGAGGDFSKKAGETMPATGGGSEVVFSQIWFVGNGTDEADWRNGPDGFFA